MMSIVAFFTGSDFRTVIERAMKAQDELGGAGISSHIEGRAEYALSDAYKVALVVHESDAGRAGDLLARGW